MLHVVETTVLGAAKLGLKMVNRNWQTKENHCHFVDFAIIPWVNVQVSLSFSNELKYDVWA